LIIVTPAAYADKCHAYRRTLSQGYRRKQHWVRGKKRGTFRLCP
jgi:hypothetical protein